MSTIAIKPLGNRIVVEPMDAESKTEGGIFIPVNTQQKQAKGTVVAVAKGSETNPMELKVGDVVLYGKFAGTEIKHDGKNFLIMEQADVLAII